MAVGTPIRVETVEKTSTERASTFSPWRFAVPAEWQPAELDGRFVKVDDHAMQPVIPAGAYVGYSACDEDVEGLEGNLVVAWVDGRPIVRWLQRWGRFAVLRANTPGMDSAAELIDLDRLAEEGPIRRVLWFSIPQ